MRRRQTRAKGRRNRRTRKQGGGVPSHLVANGPLPNVLVNASVTLQQLPKYPTLNDIASSVQTLGISKPNLMRFLPILVDLIDTGSAYFSQIHHHPVKKASSVSDADWKQIGMLADYFTLPESVLNIWVKETIWRCIRGSDPNTFFDIDKPGMFHFQLFDRLLREKHADIPRLAASHGGITLLKWYFRMSEYSVLNYSVASSAASAGDINVLALLQEHGYSWNSYITEMAADGGQLEALQWLREQKCPWDEKVCNAAALRCHMPILKWAIENGCPYKKSSLINRIQVRCKDMFDYVSGLPD